MGLRGMQRAREGHNRLTSDLHPRVFAGGARGTRTPDRLLAKQVLFQLSYSPELRRSKGTCGRGALVEAADGARAAGDTAGAPGADPARAPPAGTASPLADPAAPEALSPSSKP